MSNIVSVCRFEEARRTLKRPIDDRRDFPDDRKRVATDRSRLDKRFDDSRYVCSVRITCGRVTYKHEGFIRGVSDVPHASGLLNSGALNGREAQMKPMVSVLSPIFSRKKHI